MATREHSRQAAGSDAEMVEALQRAMAGEVYEV